MEEQTILLVEDDVALLEGMGDTLEMMGYRTIKATNGREGLERLAQVRPDLIISDIMMPEMDGYEFHQAVSSMAESSTIPFIFLTAKSDQADVRKGLREGVDAYLTKPFDLEDLLLHVQNKLDRFATIRNQTMAQLDELQRQIVTMFSHELRTPLTYIQGYTDLMADSSGATSSEEMTMFLQGIQAGSRRLNRLVESLLILVQLDTNVFTHEFERFAMVEPDAGRFVRLAATSLEPAATERGLTIAVDIHESLPALRVVSEHLVRILGNLLENAIKFTPEGGPEVVIRAYTSGDRVCFDVQDHGIGISAADQARLFQRFVQINRAQHEQPGIGVGLVIARGLALVHGGDITVQSAVGQGSTFTLWLPSINAAS